MKELKDNEIEALIQRKGLTAPRITQSDINNSIKDVQYYRFPETTTTVCLVTLHNGFTVTGESACASPENFDQEIGNGAALAQAQNKLWSYLGYGLVDALYKGRQESES
jgi:hypothetical protein